MGGRGENELRRGEERERQGVEKDREEERRERERERDGISKKSGDRERLHRSVRTYWRSE